MRANRRKSWHNVWLMVFIVAGVLSIGLIAAPRRPVVFWRGLAWVEVADTAPEREKGLMNRASLPPSQGMLFVFEQNCTPAFWMKDTQIRLSIAFLSEDKKIVDIQTMEPL
ncbi:MAG: DUF192 domain-containing protein, partial [Candidatus Omnitrophica bacterium]|nr:DUF192 domain-containing protein [Candidatus Omnitrophota bacterium]